jgi:hypothetical protein
MLERRIVITEPELDYSVLPPDLRERVRTADREKIALDKAREQTKKLLLQID